MSALACPSRAALCLAAFVLCQAAVGAGLAPAATAPGATATAVGAELAFVPDAGQLGGRARFVAHTSAGAILLGPGEIILAPRAGSGAPSLLVRYEGSGASGVLAPSRQLPTRVSYLVGSDPSRWRRD